MPTVSVIVPNFCHAPYLEERIESILAQTYRDFELILLDDCSTDNSREILERYRQHPNVSRIVYNEQNSGSPFAQWKKGLQLAQGKYIWLAESDDFSSPHFLERCTATLDAHPECALVFCSGYVVDKTSRILQEQIPIRKVKSDCTLYETRTFLYRYLLLRNAIYNAGLVLFRRDCAPQTDSYTHYRYCGDWLFWILTACNGQVAYLREPLNYYRVHGNNTTAESLTTGRKHLETLRILNEVFTSQHISYPVRLSIAGKHLERIRHAAGKHWHEEPFISIRKSWQEYYPHPTLAILWHKLYKGM